jgi:hypothetical protein
MIVNEFHDTIVHCDSFFCIFQTGEDIIDFLSFSFDHRIRNIWILIFMLLAARVAALIALRFKVRHL